MAILIAATGLAFLALPGVTRRWGKGLAPDEWGRLCGGALAVGLSMFELGALLTAAPTVLRAAGAPTLAAACERTLVPLLPGGAVAGWVAAAIAITVPVLAWVGLRRARRGRDAVRIEPTLGEHFSVGEHDLVVLPTERLVAVSVGGDPAQIVVSTGLLGVLDHEQVDAVIRHEAAHLHHGHERFLLLATVVEHAAAAFPPARRSAATLRVAIERWADEAAAGAANGCSRRSLRDALLGMTAAVVTPSSVAAFSPLDSLAERVDALATGPRPSSALRRAAIYVPGVVLGGVAVAALGAFLGDAQTVLAMAGRCTV
ncbi:MAG: M48 family metalloprotease [Acidimicrobiia bacterium]